MNSAEFEWPAILNQPDTLSVSCEGFGKRLSVHCQTLKEAPYIDTYRALKPLIRSSIVEPFKRFRDDVVINLVLPNQLPFETERNVFSRLLKNDFGAGGCHHHLWMSFYRMGMRRLSDLQLAHTLRDNGFSSSLYIGDNAPDLFKKVKKRIAENPVGFLECVNTLLERESWYFRVRPHNGKRGTYIEYTTRLLDLPNEIVRSKGIWWGVFSSKEAILDKGELLVGRSIEAIQALWPLYLFLLDENLRH